MIGRSRKRRSASKPKSSPQEKKHLDELLDEALIETFPASDPLAMLELAPRSHRSHDDKDK